MLTSKVINSTKVPSKVSCYLSCYVATMIASLSISEVLRFTKVCCTKVCCTKVLYRKYGRTRTCTTTVHVGPTILLRKYPISTLKVVIYFYIPVFYFRMKVQLQRVYTVRRYKVTYLHRYLQYKYKYTYFAA